MSVFTIIATVAQLLVSLFMPIFLFLLAGARSDMQKLKDELTAFRVTIIERVARVEALQGVRKGGAA